MKNLLLINAILAILLCPALSVQAQTQNINASSGTVSVGCSEYTNNLDRTWNINIGVNKRVKITYNVNTETTFDYVTIAHIDALGNTSALRTLSGTVSGTAYSAYPTGKILIKFHTDGSVYCTSGYPYTGFSLSFSPDDRTELGATLFNEPVAGNAFGNALRVQTAYGYLDIGPQNDVYAHLSTDRGGFWLTKPLYLQDGILGAHYNLNLLTNGTYRMTILNSNGNVGIGTTTPNTKLDVMGNVYIPAGSSYWIGSYSDTGNRLRMHHSGSSAFIDYSPNLYIRSGITNVASFLDNGNVGIGTANPQSKLEVNGNVTVDGNIIVGLYRGDNDVPPGYAKKVDFGSFENWDPIWIARYNVAPDASELRINIGDAPDERDRFVIGTTHWDTQQWAELFSIRANGNVGIGTSAPTNKLEVNGTIRAKEVKIELNNWADHVFEPAYRLPSLKEVESHIQEHGHLPGIPTQAEVEADGVDLGSMNVKLLQKIEELTLYMVEQNRKIESLETELKQLKK
jgi:hypothetical protein